MHLFVIPDPLNHACELILVLVAFWLGGWRSRLLASTLFLVALTQHVLFAMTQALQPYSTPHLLIASLDLANLAACYVAVRTAERYWVVWVASLTLVALATQALWLFKPALSVWAVGSAMIVWRYALIGGIAWGVFAESRSRTARVLMA